MPWAYLAWPAQQALSVVGVARPAVTAPAPVVPLPVAAPQAPAPLPAVSLPAPAVAAPAAVWLFRPKLSALTRYPPCSIIR
ncbi:hypothetical protein FY115_13750 [Cellvibrio japonicus]|nr:hypothetical protein FY117_13750 [Cellvibrio japonicus]QEI16758.1 hypothetical protein FY116_13755 [Cellvibrio japonicus]QEI20336.1 hypothetical protein FY115_13750 [Cellvibrio japonicus]